jgi:REP element-mobilizing transposase RayT
MSNQPLAYHITFGTYGTRLHGDPRGTVDRSRNKHGDPIIGRNVDWHNLEAGNLVGGPVVFDQDIRGRIEQAVGRVCDRGGWVCHAAACQTNHVHVLITSGDDSKLIRRLLKRWLSEYLNSEAGAGADVPKRWWTKGGSIKWVWDEAYFQNVCRYIERQQASVR